MQCIKGIAHIKRPVLSKIIRCLKLSGQHINFADPESFASGGPNVVVFFLLLLVYEGKRIQIPLKAGYHRPTSETPLK